MSPVPSDVADLKTVNIGNARLYGMEEELNLKGNQYQIAVSILFVTYCVNTSGSPLGSRTNSNRVSKYLPTYFSRSSSQDDISLLLL